MSAPPRFDAPCSQLTRAPSDFAESRVTLSNFDPSLGFGKSSACDFLMCLHNSLASVAEKGAASACRTPVFPHYSESDEGKEEPKWGRPNLMRTPQLLHVIGCGADGREEDLGGKRGRCSLWTPLTDTTTAFRLISNKKISTDSFGHAVSIGVIAKQCCCHGDV